MKFHVNYTLREIIFNRINQRIKEDIKKTCSCEHTSETKEISISSKLGMVPLNQLNKILD